MDKIPPKMFDAAGVPDGYVPTVSAGEAQWAAPPVGTDTGGGAGGGFLASVVVNPATQTQHPVTGTAYKAFTSAYAVSFTVPASGAVLVCVSGMLSSLNSAIPDVGLLDEGGALLPGMSMLAHYLSTGPGEFDVNRTFRFPVQGLVAGAARTFTFAGRCRNNSGSVDFPSGGLAGPVLLTVEAL